MVMVMFGDACAPSATASLPSSIARLYLPPPSPVRSNWYTAFMPFAAFALKRFGISLNTSGTFVACGRSAMGLPPFVEDVVVDLWIFLAGAYLTCSIESKGVGREITAGLRPRRGTRGAQRRASARSSDARRRRRPPSPARASGSDRARGTCVASTQNAPRAHVTPTRE